jgi:putative DNA primase/helicase
MSAQDFNALSRIVTDQIKANTQRNGGHSLFSAETVHLGDEFGLVSAASIEPKAIQWLWPDYLPKGKITILAGKKAAGKTALAIAIAAIVSRGGVWPDASRATKGRVIIWSAEDDAADTLIPRLMLADADLSNIDIVTGPFDPSIDLPKLETKLVASGGADLMVLDPIIGAVSGDSHKATDVRRGLQPLVNLLGSLGCCGLGVTHFAKATENRDPTERVIGSQAYSAIARVVLVAARGKDGKRILTRSDTNLGPAGDGFSYELAVDSIPGRPDLGKNIVVRWADRLSGSAVDLLAQCEGDPGKPSPGDTAEEFIRSELADGPKPNTDIEAAAREAGISYATLRRASDRLGVQKKKKGPRWYWELPKMLSDTEDAHPGEWTSWVPDEHLREEMV